MTTQLRQFCLNWIGKADAYQTDALADHFDKFTSLFVVYNALYMQVMDELILAGHQLPKDFKDNKAATDYVVQYLKSTFFINQLLNNNQNVESLNSICTIIEEEQFHIILHLGQHQRPLDLELLDQLRANSKQEKAKAVLKLLYHIRCNLFHGQKGFENRQRDLLIPVNILLRRTVEITFNKLEGDGQ